MKKVLVLAKDYPPTIGGVENYSFYVAEGLSKKFQVNVLTFKGRDSENTWTDSVKVYRINPIVKGSESIKGLQFFFNLLWLLLVGKFDIVYATTWKIGIPSRILKYIFRFKFIVVSHGAEITRHKDKLHLVKLMNYVLTAADAIISVSEFTKSKVIEYSDVKESDIYVVPNGIDTNKLTIYPKEVARSKLQIQAELFTILTVSRVDERKGHEIVIKAIPEIVKKISNFKYIVVGNGPVKKELEALVLTLKLTKFVEFMGFVPNEDLDYYYSSTDIFIMMNTMKDDKDFEGFGLVFAEAGYYGIPLVGGNNSGPKEVILDNETGYLLDESINDVSEKIINLFYEKGKLKTFGKNAKRRTDTFFTIEKMINGIEVVINLVLK